MKLSKDTVAKREQFIREAVRANPKITGDQLQELLHQHFGKRMRIGRLYEVKNSVLDTLTEKAKAYRYAGRNWSY